MKRNITLATLTTMALILNACGGGGSSTKTTTIQGKFIDSPVYGAEYRCGNVQNLTQADGKFTCETLPVTFYVGDVVLGSVSQLPADGYVTPQDLVGVPRDNYDTAVNNVALFLQSLDDDGNIETAIQIRQETRDKLKNKPHDIHAMTHDQVVDLLEEVNVVNIVSREEAYEHLRKHVESIPVKPTTSTPTKPTTSTPTKPTTSTPTKPTTSTPTKPTTSTPTKPTTSTPTKPTTSTPTKHRP